MQKIAEVVESSTTQFVAECYELYGLPPLGSLVKTSDGDTELHAVVCNATTSSIEPGRRPIARGKGEVSEAELYRSNPQLAKLLRSEFIALVVGHRRDNKLFRYLPPTPARIHSFVFPCGREEIEDFSRSFDFVPLMLNARFLGNTEEVTAATLRLMSQAHADPRQFLVKAGKELAALMGGDYGRLRLILRRLKE